MELAGLEPHPQMTGRSLAELLQARRGRAGSNRDRDVMLVGKERHDIGRPYDWGYPVRAIRTPEYLYIHNYFPDRWPAGNPETDFGNCDPSPTKELLKAIGGEFYDMSFGKRPGGGPLQARRRPRVPAQPRPRPLLRAGAGEAPRPDAGDAPRGERPRALGNGAVFDQYKYVGGRTKGYETWLNAQAQSYTPAPRAKGDATAKKQARKKAAAKGAN